MSNEVTTSAQASVAADEGSLKRSIQMKFFAGKNTVKRVSIASAKIKAGETPEGTPDAVIVGGQIIGQIFDVKEKLGTLPDGTEKVSLLAMGEFEATNYETGEVITSAAAYLPTYYLETVQSMLAKDASASLVFAVEISIMATGKSIPYAYEVKNLVRRRPDNPLNALKAEMAKAGRLRLPPPPPHGSDVLEGEVLAIATTDYVTTDVEEAASDAAADPPLDEAPPAAAKGKK
jgi:hypothetical protein